MTKERNRFVDIIRGVAMLLVVLGHTMTGSTKNSENTFLFSIVWSLQMPLFILISGYVTRYTKQIYAFGDLLKFILKRTVAYLLPFAVWSFLIRGIILGQRNYLDIKYMLWHVDSGYWFLITIWTISVIFGISNYISAFIKNPFSKKLMLTLMYITGMVALVVIGRFTGMSFLGIKLTLYYMPFYYAGWLYGQYREKIFAFSAGKTTVDIIIAVSLAVWIFCLIKFNLFTMEDSGLNVIIRGATSLCGCIAVCGLLKGAYMLNTGMRWCKALNFVGVNSLEIYLVHYLFLNVVSTADLYELFSIRGVGLVALNYAIVVAITIAIIILTDSNRTLRFFLYGKKNKWCYQCFGV